MWKEGEGGLMRTPTRQRDILADQVLTMVKNGHGNGRHPDSELSSAERAHVARIFQLIREGNL